MDGLTVTLVRSSFTKIAEKLEASADELNALDAVLGDGDLGVSLVRGARSVVAELPSLPEQDCGASLTRCALAITKISGSTCGTLLASGLLSAANSVMGKSVVEWSEMPRMIASAAAAISRRGKCELGDKTILDAVEAARVAIEGLNDPYAIVEAAEQAVAEAIETLRPKVSRQGRARIFPDRSAGNPDPGMVAFRRILEALK